MKGDNSCNISGIQPTQATGQSITGENKEIKVMGFEDKLKNMTTPTKVVPKVIFCMIRIIYYFLLQLFLLFKVNNINNFNMYIITDIPLKYK